MPIATADPEYALGHSQREMERLRTQSEAFEPFTRRMFQKAGLTWGMRVLDIGSGAGDVALLAASFVGESGQVIGVDRALTAVESANARARSSGLRNVTFTVGDPREMVFRKPFDAVVGRLVLMYQSDPAEMLRIVSRQLRPGGIIAFQEFDIEGAQSYPQLPVFTQSLGWIKSALQQTGADIRMGLKLFSSFVAAGLPEPAMSFEACIAGGSGNPGCFMIPPVVRSLLPVLERFGIASAEEVQIDTLEERLRSESVSQRGIGIAPTLIGAWARLP